MTDQEQKTLARSYVNAGSDFVASRLAYIFGSIDNQDDVAVHNFITNEISLAVGIKNNKEINMMYCELSRVVLNYIEKGIVDG